ncbi:DUF423 domain-containing protein [Crocinitomicaceae bacterium]|nr:DUF423 domain-containing protein [Crocinitomicaceae bacterium]
MNKKIVLTGVSFIIIGIVLGAFGAHSLKKVLNADRLLSFEVGVRYQLFHGLALVVLGALSDRLLVGSKWSTRFIILGVLLFSCSIYLLSLQDLLGVSLQFLGPLTPIGGSFMIVGWILLIKRISG